jgi:chemotaxis protein MotB
MRPVSKKTSVLILCLLSFVLLTGCTDWKKKYQNLEVEHQNTLGLLERERGEKLKTAEAGQKTIDELQKEMNELKKSPASATGFKYGDVSVNAAEGTITVTLDNAILFDSGKADLKKSTSVELDQIASVLKSKYSGKKIDVVGNTDTDPIQKSKWKDNWELSTERALAVVRYLVSHGVPSDRVRASGCGEHNPVSSNSSATGKAKNRRVEIVVYMRS